MKHSTLPIILTACLAACAFAETRLGKPLALKETASIDAILSTPAAFAGKPVQVKGKITEVCQMAGCWMALVDPGSGKSIRVKVNDGEIVFPGDSVGKSAIAEGVFTKTELTRDQALASAKHEAEERGRKFDPSKIKSGATIYQIRGTGAVVLD